MADDIALGHVGDPDADEVEQDEDDSYGDDPEPPKSLVRYLEGWRFWYNLVVHRGEFVLPVRQDPYTENYVSDKVKPAPFPLSISETWYCGALLALAIAVHNVVDKGWPAESGSGRLEWAGRVFSRVFLTVGAAVLSTFSFEIAGSMLGQVFHYFMLYIQDRVSRLLIIHLRWGEVGTDGEPLRDDDGDFFWIRDLSYRRESIRNIFQGAVVLVLDYASVILIDLGNRLVQTSVESVLGPFLHFFFSIPVDFVPNLLSWLALPTPGLDGVKAPRTMWFEYGVPIAIQFQVLVFLWLLRILYMAKAERLGLQGWRVSDPKMDLVWHLIRATAMHLLAYTTYQLVCGIIVALRAALPQGSRLITIIDGPIVPFLGKLIPEGRIFAAALLFFFHWLFRVVSLIEVRLARPLWMPYILWQTRYSRYGAGKCWPLFVESLGKDLTVLNPSKRVISRALMTALFGLRSSWPARFQLSGVIEDN